MSTTKERIVIDYAPLSLKEKTKLGFERFPKSLLTYVSDMLPIIQWISHYNFSWLIQDMIAGITVGMLIVPQGIAYAKIANLEPQYGLYTSFVGVSLYCFFGTSKDISIGPITIVSLLVGQAITQVKLTHPEITGPEVAVTLSLFAGVVTLLVSLSRLGSLVEFISEPVIAGYMTGSAITISLGQWPKIFGIEQVNTHDANYKIFYEFFKNIQTTRLDAAFGLVTLVILYGVRWISGRMTHRFVFFLNIMRSALVVVAGTLISFLINRNHRENPLIDIIEEVPAGFDAMAIPSLNLTVLKETSSVLPSIVVILILEHISVAKSFSRANNYTINSNQEILAIGLSNLIGSFFGAYPSTGAFSRTAVMARSGVKTPIAGVFSGAVVVLALYVLTPAFFYIPEAVLAAVVIHAVLDLMAGPTFLKTLWKTSIVEFFIFVVSVIISCFADIETAIYVSVGLYLLLLFFRLSRPEVVSVGRIEQDSLDELFGKHYTYVNEEDPNFASRTSDLPQGLLIVRPTQSILYPSANHVSEQILHLVKSRTRPGSETGVDEKPWNEVLAPIQEGTSNPQLEYLLLDFGSVHRMDVTAMHVFSSLKMAVEKYSGRQVEWHFCGIPNERVREFLVRTGFGCLPEINRLESVMMEASDVDGDGTVGVNSQSIKSNNDYCPKEVVCLSPVDIYPAFHWDIETAIQVISERRSRI